MNICTKVYQVAITYQGQTQTYSKNLSHDCHLTQDQINEAMVQELLSGSYGRNRKRLNSHGEGFTLTPINI